MILVKVIVKTYEVAVLRFSLFFKQKRKIHEKGLNRESDHRSSEGRHRDIP